jgi:hypothetical protein
MPGPVKTEGEFIDIVLLLGQWRPVMLLPQGNVANSELVRQVVFSVDGYTELPDTPTEPLRYSAFGSADELGDYIEYSGNIRLVSSRFRELLDDFGQQDVRFFRAEIETGPSINARTQKYGGGAVLKDFWWMHHWRRHDLVDVAQSQIRYAQHIPPLPKDQSHIDVDRSESLILRSPPAGEGLYGLRRWPNYRIVTPALSARIREAGLRVSLFPRALSPEAKAQFTTGLRNELEYFPQP